MSDGVQRAAWLAVCCVTAVAGCAQPHALRWVLEYEGDAPPLAAAHLLEIRMGSCEAGARTAYRAELRRFLDTPMDVPALPAGTYGFFAEARDAECAVLARGCTVVTLPRADVEVLTTLATARGEPACGLATCRGGLCETDAGTPDAGVETGRPDVGSTDASAFDAQVPDASADDAALDDAAAPDAATVDACTPTTETCDTRDEDCDGRVDETFNFTNDLANCGFCGNLCADPPNAGATCSEGACRFTCRGGFDDCTAEPGCESSLTDASSCGACGTVCRAPTPVCGTVPATGLVGCIPSCGAGETICGSTCANLTSDLAHCGSCTTACSLPHATARCTSSACEIASCDPGYDDCDGIDSNGCEVFLTTDPLHCGACTTTCGECQRCGAGTCSAAPDVTTTCSTGVCVAGSCCSGCRTRVGGIWTCSSGATDTACGGAGAMCAACGRCTSCSLGACMANTEGSACTGTGSAGTCHGGACCSTCWNGSACAAPISTAACGTAGLACATCSCFCSGAGMCDVGTFRAVDAGDRHTCVSHNSLLYCWGANTDGQLGIGTMTAFENAPRVVTGPFGASATISLGLSHSCSSGLMSDSYCWGSNVSNQLGIVIPGTSVAVPTQINASSSTGVRSGDAHSCWTLGTIQCWGRNLSGQLGLGTTGVDVTSPTSIVPPVSSPLSLSLGGAHTCYVTSSRQLFCFGLNTSGQLGLGMMSPNVPTATRESTLETTWTSVDLGSEHTCAIQSDRTLWCWGLNANGQLGLGDTMTRSDPTQVGTAAWTRVSAGLAHTCGIQLDGSLWCWGAGLFGQNGTSGDEQAPVRVGTASDFTEVAAGGTHTCAIRPNGVYCWGNNAVGQLGLGVGGPSQTSTPTRVCGF